MPTGRPMLTNYLNYNIISLEEGWSCEGVNRKDPKVYTNKLFG